MIFRNYNICYAIFTISQIYQIMTVISNIKPLFGHMFNYQLGRSRPEIPISHSLAKVIPVSPPPL